ncbi:MAG: hypothetical protein IJS65_05450, partial [Clostridia bacterium]|nr:hypothetical protein [Clostridia bacterium]
MQNNSLFKLWLAIALTAALFAAVMVVSAFAVDVDNETDFLTALTTAPADEETVIKITGDFVIEAKDSFTPPEGAIIVITSD